MCMRGVGNRMPWETWANLTQPSLITPLYLWNFLSKTNRFFKRLVLRFIFREIRVLKIILEL